MVCSGVLRFRAWPSWVGPSRSEMQVGVDQVSGSRPLTGLPYDLAMTNGCFRHDARHVPRQRAVIQLLLRALPPPRWLLVEGRAR
jgi:hypothetical protein